MRAVRPGQAYSLRSYRVLLRWKGRRRSSVRFKTLMIALAQRHRIKDSLEDVLAQTCQVSPFSLIIIKDI